MKYILGFLFLVNSVFLSNGQKQLEAHPTLEKITVDGVFDESCWKSASKALDFVQVKPNPGENPVHPTEVQVAYDNQAMYVAVFCFDKPEHISKVLSQRDDFNANVDNFQFFIDTYNDDQNGFVFGVSSLGVQYDSKQFTNTESLELNMVWNSAVKHHENGWSIEMRIPYSAFRFPSKDIQDWGINFYRYISRNREESTWSPIKPDFDNWVAQNGVLLNVKGISPPLRLAFMPYVSGYVDHYPSTNTSSDWSRSFNGGMDIKYGINEAFTMDMTLVPDFGQVVFDNQVLNLSPFEVQFNENRQFFTEGTELFNKSGLFYSRRIGIQAPYGVLSNLLEEDERLSNVPGSSQLYNATKVSGRTKKGLGIGVFNAITAPQYATAINLVTNAEREILASPLTNYNVLVLDQNIKNNGYVTLTNTNVLRNGTFYDANVTGLNTKFNTKSNAYFLKANGSLSGKYYAVDTDLGHKWNMSLGRQTGKIIYSVSYQEESDTYDPNDMGFIYRNNYRSLNTSISYRIFKPFWKLNQFSATLGSSYNRLYQPNVYTETNLNGSIFMNSKRFHAAGIQANSSVTKNYDYFEPRTDGYYFIRPQSIEYGGWISTNYQKRFALDLNIYVTNFAIRDWKTWFYSFSPRWRVSNKIFLVYELQQTFIKGERGYAVAFGVPAETTNEIVFGNRDRIDITNTIDFNYTLTNRMGITFRLRHYRSLIEYNYLYDLQLDGTLVKNTLNGLDTEGNNVYNTNFNAFTIDFVYRWVFLPGSEINLVWKNAIFSSDKLVAASYLNNLSRMFDYSPSNSFSIKLLYWLDYQSLKRKSKKIE